jgi:hypothetical protein
MVGFVPACAADARAACASNAARAAASSFAARFSSLALSWEGGVGRGGGQMRGSTAACCTAAVCHTDASCLAQRRPGLRLPFRRTNPHHPPSLPPLPAAHRTFSVIALMPLLASPAALKVACIRSFPDRMVTVSIAFSSLRVSASASVTGPRLSATGRDGAAGSAPAAAAARLGSAGGGGGGGGSRLTNRGSMRCTRQRRPRQGAPPNNALRAPRTQLCRQLVARGARLVVVLAAARVDLAAHA